MIRALRLVTSHPKTALIISSLLVAATGLFLTSGRSPEIDAVRETPSETTYASSDSTNPRLGAAVYFPQGTNPSLLESLSPETNGAVEIDSARLRGEIVEVFGTSDGESGVRCELRGADGLVLSPESVQNAEGAFLQSFRPPLDDGAETSLFVECRVGGVSDEVEVSVG